MKLAKVLAVGAAMVLLSTAGRADDKDNAKLIVGKWEVAKADPGTAPPGGTVEFTKDGKMIVTAKDKSAEGTYKLDGKKLTFVRKMGGEEKSKTITITKLTATEMATQDEDGKKVELTRKK